ncbi:homeobox protein [Musa troglodytarum]|uniref:Homeobox protein n=1 Tax=Musa troglodytarum TaxID=320322 RepID=A0A9E7GYC1_9LILI|nr:homeobox protein [Musa troglodytarum]
MEEFSQLGGNLWGGLMCSTSPAAKSTGDTGAVAMVAPPSGGASVFDKGHDCIPNPLLLGSGGNQNSHLLTKHEGASSSHFPPCDVGAPPEVVDRLSAVAQELEMRQRASLICRDAPTDPELDQFMEAYHEMLVKYREELTRPLQEAMEFLRRVEAQLNSLSLTDGSLRILSAGRANTSFTFCLVPPTL